MAGRLRHALIVSADDLGYCAQRTDGILRAIQQGVATSSTLLVTGADAPRAARLVSGFTRPDGIRISLGLHLNLTEGRPCTVASDAEPYQMPPPCLVDEQRMFRGKGSIVAMVADPTLWSSSTQQWIERELGAQVAAFVALVGSPPSHIDGHNHIHVFPGFVEVVARAAAAHGITKIRIPQPCQPVSSGNAFLEQVASHAAKARDVYSRHGFSSPEWLLGLDVQDTSPTCNTFASRVAKACAASTVPTSDASAPRPSLNGATILEWMAHPGIPCTDNTTTAGCGQGPDDFAQSPDRQAELDMLVDPRLPDLLQAAGVTLCSFHDLS
eukprot:m.50698 g.50698  ORF g.50698 m.50698 type:complete len:326 (+) comp12170_c0_seq4:254-1231(+)